MEDDRERTAERRPREAFPLGDDGPSWTAAVLGERRRFILEDGDVPGLVERQRRFHRRWKGTADRLGPNEVRCPRCGVVMRSYRELRDGDRVHCAPCGRRFLVEEHLGALRATPPDGLS